MTERRKCGDCQLCCRLLPVNAVNKLANETCKHQCATGCAVYPKLESVSPECRLWTCAWLVNAAGQLQRPDRSHVVIDVMPDYVSVPIGPKGELVNIPAVQVWIDPDHKDAHRDPALREYLEECGKRGGACAIIRYGSSDGFVLFPPSLTGRGWHEEHTPPTQRDHTPAEVIDAIGGMK